MTKPNFFIIGAPKCGTTSLHAYISTHPDVYMCTPKEPNFFTSQQITEQGLYYKAKCISNTNDYINLFTQGCNCKIRGEASVSSLFYTKTATAIHTFNPDAKIVAVLRDPIKRAMSHYLMDKRLGYVNKDLDVIFRQGEGLHFQQYFELGLYAKQLSEYIAVFPENQIRLYLFDDLCNDKEAVLTDLCQFLSIPPNSDLATSGHHNTFKEPSNALFAKLYKNAPLRAVSRILIPLGLKQTISKTIFKTGRKPLMSNSLNEYLKEFYQKDVIELQQLLGRDLSLWLS